MMDGCSLFSKVELSDDLSEFVVKLGHAIDMLHAEVPLVDVRVVCAEVLVRLEGQSKDGTDLTVEENVHYGHLVAADEGASLFELLVQHTQEATLTVNGIALLLFVLCARRSAAEHLCGHDHANEALGLGSHLRLEPVEELFNLGAETLWVQVLTDLFVRVDQIVDERVAATNDLELALSDHRDLSRGILSKVSIFSMLLVEHVHLLEGMSDAGDLQDAKKGPCVRIEVVSKDSKPRAEACCLGTIIFATSTTHY